MRVALRDRFSRAASWWNHAPTGQSFRTGFLDMLPTMVATGTWGLVMGIALVKSGLTDSMATLMTVLVYAGSAQLTSLPLIEAGAPLWLIFAAGFVRSEEHTSELQSLMRISYAGFCLKKKNKNTKRD